MITKTDCMSILVKLEDKGIDKATINSYVNKLLLSKDLPLDVLRFISQNQGIEVTNFYEMLRKKHNEKKDKLYTNIVKDISDPEDTILTLNCLLTQVLLYSKKIEDRSAFLKEARAEEITRVLNKYFSTDSLDDCVTLLKLIRSDLLVLEYINGRRDLEQ